MDKLAEVSQPVPGLPAPPQFETIGDIYTKLDAPRASHLIHHILPNLSLLDPACGSGAFLVAALKTLVNIYQGIIGRITFLKDNALKQWLEQQQQQHPSLDYFIKKTVITNNLYGVDIMAEAVEIARLRLFLALVASAENVADLEPLPNIDFNILPGNSLIGLLRVDEKRFSHYTDKSKGSRIIQPDQATQLGLFSAGRAVTYREIVSEKNRLVAQYKDASSYSDDLQVLRDHISAHRQTANATLNQILLDEFSELKIMFEQATWDVKKNKPGKAKKRPLTLADIEGLDPFHWGYEFDEVMNERGGFDAIITNPPWEALRPQAKEFFTDYSNVVSKKKMSIEAFKEKQKELLNDTEIREAWLDFLSRFAYQSHYYRIAPQYSHQWAVVNGRKTGSDINLYKLFTGRSFDLLRNGGQCGIVIPTGICIDLGATGLRKMLFNHTRINGIFGMENRRLVFEGVHRSIKIAILSFTKGEQSEAFPATFMRDDVNELSYFPNENALSLNVDLIEKMSPDTLSIMEFKGNVDVQILKKLVAFPLLGQDIENTWKLSLTREFDMTNDSDLFETEVDSGFLALYEGKMIHQFDHQFRPPRYWVPEQKGRKGLLRRTLDENQKLDYQNYRIGFRSAGENTNIRNFIATIIPKNAFCGNSIISSQEINNDWKLLLYLSAIFNSF
ncbi:MAG: ATP-binding protein, partial [Cyclobacteriaceae bacterium]|nr:ATP-binding protein [Cyclobacteriaceae bacterium]